MKKLKRSREGTRKPPQRWVCPAASVSAAARGDSGAPRHSRGVGEAADFGRPPLRPVSKQHEACFRPTPSAAAKGCIPVESSTRSPALPPSRTSPPAGATPERGSPGPGPAAQRSPPSAGPRRLTGSSPDLRAGELRRAALPGLPTQGVRVSGAAAGGLRRL